MNTPFSPSNSNHSSSTLTDLPSANTPTEGQPWLVKERDACGVGFFANLDGSKTHHLVAQSLVALGCLEHRGGCSADRDSGDGSGVMTGIPKALFAQWFADQGLEVPADEAWGVGMAFLPQDPDELAQARTSIENEIKKAGLACLGWRVVPVRPEVLGVEARKNQPQIEQVIVSSPEGLRGDELDRKLYITRSRIGKALSDDYYFCSFSCRTLVYKGMVRSVVLGEFYTDLKDERYESQFAVYHRRFSTNTMPRWPLAQPMRLLGHNGEINTLLGNINWMATREAHLSVPGWEPGELESLRPIVNSQQSDSFNLDSAMELLVRTGRTPLEAAMILVPEAYQNQPELDTHPEIVNFYDFYSGFQEPWDGPALLVCSDGKKVAAILDRNGLRPARYCITKDNLVVVASEAGVIDLVEADILEKGRLGPGQLLAVDLATGDVLKNWDVKQQIAQAQPYGEWLKQRHIIEPDTEYQTVTQLDSADCLKQQAAFGFTAEDVDMIVVPMATLGKEPTFCMGDDIPLAVLSTKAHPLYDYFKQRFAQVTNPPIDPLRESLVMSLNMLLGKRGNLMDIQPSDARQLKVDSPVLNEAQLSKIKTSGFKVTELSTLFAIADGNAGFQARLEQLCTEAAQAVRDGAEVLILSDRAGGQIVDAELGYLPPLVAVGAVHHHLIREGLRLDASLVVDTAQCWSTHHYACLVGFGASAICPYLTWETVRQWWHDSRTQSMFEKGTLESISLETAMARYRKSVEGGLLKILSKMGISLLSSYHGAQIFEAIGLGGDLVTLAFNGTTSRLGGLSIAELADETFAIHHRAFPNMVGKKLENLGFIAYRNQGEYHMNSPKMAKALHKAVEDKQYDHYEVYTNYLETRTPTALRDLLDFAGDHESIPMDQVEPVEEIVKRFCTGAMSLGSLSREAHETLAIAMNRIGGKSNSGEGGEDPIRQEVIQDADAEGLSQLFSHLKGLRNGDTANSAIKQVASGRFGVTPAYLMSGQQIEIKMAQGAKPGEGGQLPGKKVSSYIAMLRRSKAGVPLISPPPHHDIYSIEDLAQLIFDLHQIHPQAQVSVKLVAEIGIGTIAAGVAKANADVIQISGHDGGTGASPLSSIKHAGSPWELGVTEVHRVLMENGLRDRVLLRADGGFKTGYDVVMAALMGAEEYGFGSVAMIAEGCIMARVCHMNTCPVGVATQQERLRKRFPGTPENVVNFFYFVAEEVRSLLAKLGYRKLADIIGRGDILTPRAGVTLSKTQSLNLDCLTQLPDVRSDRSWLEHGAVHTNGPVLDDDLLADDDILAAIRDCGVVEKTYKVVNTDRSVGARLSGRIASQYGDKGFEGEITLNFHGSAGQSFGSFNLLGMKLVLTGESNDYVGKGMNGGEIIITPPPEAPFIASENVLIGNTCLYGATGGTLYANGRAGERFAVRNSKGTAVIEGAGDHCCEYMTGGVVVVLGKVGRNVGAGMTGGLGYFLDEEGTFEAKVNREIVSTQRVIAPAGEQQLKDLISAHVERTGSPKGQQILDDWEIYLPQFWQVVPPSEADTAPANPEVAIADKALTSV